MLTDLNDTHIIQIKKNRRTKCKKQTKKRKKKDPHTHTVGTAPQTKRKIVERCKYI
jgi:hypothetical protein